MKLNHHQALIAANILAALGVPAEEAVAINAADNRFEPGRVTEYEREQFMSIPTIATNASQFSANNPHEFLSQYAVRYTDPNIATVDAVRQRLAPDVSSNNSSYVDYAVYGFTDAFLSQDNVQDDIRGFGADFATLRNPTKQIVSQKLQNRGLAIEVDEDEELLDPDWQQQKIAWLIGILDRNRLRRTVALFVAIATAVSKTWDASAGKDPDMDLLTELENMMIRATDMIMGPGAMTKRRMAHRAQNTAGGFASASFSDEEIASYLSLNSVSTVRARYATSASVTSPIIGSLVLLFVAMQGMSRFDYSNLKTFTAPARNPQGASIGKRAVYVRQVGDKRWRIAVDAGRELTAVTSAIGAECITVN